MVEFDNPVAQCSSLDEVRANIDRLDREIVKMLAERGKYVVQAARFKQTVTDVYAPARVEQVVANVRGYAARYGVSPQLVEQAYRVLVAGFTEAELAAHRT